MTRYGLKTKDGLVRNPSGSELLFDSYAVAEMYVLTRAWDEDPEVVPVLVEVDDDCHS